MPNINITLTDEEYAGLKKAQELMDLSGASHGSPEAYAQFIATSAAQSYIQQYDENTVEGLKNILSVKEEALAREKAAREAVKSQLAAKLSEESPAP